MSAIRRVLPLLYNPENPDLKSGYTVLKMYSLEQQILFNFILFGNKCHGCKEGPLYLYIGILIINVIQFLWCGIPVHTYLYILVLDLGY